MSVLALVGWLFACASAARFTHQQHIAFEDALQNSTKSVKKPTLISTVHNASATVSKSRRSAAVQELLGILANEMKDKQPLEEFLPVCLAHLKKLIKAMDQAYTDVQLHFMLEHECWLVESFPHAYSHGFETKRACHCFSDLLSNARMWELHDGSQDRYTEFCTAYYNDPNAEGMSECEGEAPPWGVKEPETLGPGGPFIEPLEKAKAQPEPLEKAKVQPGKPDGVAPLGSAVTGPGDETVSRGKGGKDDKVGAAVKPTMEPPFVPGMSEEEDAEIERQMREMQKRIEGEVESAKRVSPEDEERRRRLEVARQKAKRGKAIECPYKSGSYEWCDYIIDGEPTYDKEHVAWDSKSTANRIEDQVEKDTLTGDGPEAHAIVPSDKPLPDWARKKIEEARERNAKREASGDMTQAKYNRIDSHWKALRDRSKKEKGAKQASQHRYDTQWDRMKQITESKRLRNQAEREIAYDDKSWPWRKDDPEYDQIDVQQKKPKEPPKPVSHPNAPHSLAACAVSPLVLFAGIIFIGHP